MKRAKSGLFLVLISLVLVVIGYVFVSGCLSSAIGHEDITAANDEKIAAPHAFPPMYNYPKDVSALPGDNSCGKFLPGDILQPKESSPVFDRDLAVIVVRDTNDGSYVIDGISRSGGTWSRISDSVAGTISHSEIERLFPDKIGHIDVATLPIGHG